MSVIAFCIKKYLFACCEISTDDERKVRNIVYLIFPYHAGHCSFLFFERHVHFQFSLHKTSSYVKQIITVKPTKWIQVKIVPKQSCPVSVATVKELWA